MSQIDTGRQRGQAMTEFVIGMLVVIPVMLGIVYIGKYQDIKYSAVQASRYAAFERVFDPASSSRHKSDAVIAAETQARFFTDPMQNNSGAVAYQESAQGRSLNRNWLGTGSEPLVTQVSGIGVTVQPPSGMSIPINQGFDALATANFNISDPGLAQSSIHVPLARFTHFDPLKSYTLAIDAQTTVLTDGYNAGGADSPAPNNVHDRVFFDWGLVLGKIPGFQSLLNILQTSIVAKLGWEALSDTNGPQFGCVTPDIVPADATSQSVPPNYAANCP